MGNIIITTNEGIEEIPREFFHSAADRLSKDIMKAISTRNGLFVYEGEINTPAGYYQFESDIKTQLKQIKEIMAKRYRWKL